MLYIAPLRVRKTFFGQAGGGGQLAGAEQGVPQVASVWTQPPQAQGETVGEGIARVIYFA